MSGDHTHDDVAFVPKRFDIVEGTEDLVRVYRYSESVPQHGELVIAVVNGRPRLAVVRRTIENFDLVYRAEFLT